MQQPLRYTPTSLHHSHMNNIHIAGNAKTGRIVQGIITSYYTRLLYTIISLPILYTYLFFKQGRPTKLQPKVEKRVFYVSCWILMIQIASNKWENLVFPSAKWEKEDSSFCCFATYSYAYRADRLNVVHLHTHKNMCLNILFMLHICITYIRANEIYLLSIPFLIMFASSHLFLFTMQLFR